MSQPRKVAIAFDYYAIWNAPIGEGVVAQIPFVPIAYHADAPPNADGAAVPVLVAHEILVSNPGPAAILVTPAILEDNTTKAWSSTRSVNKATWVDPTTFPAVTATNAIIVPAGAIAFPIRVRAYGVTISSPYGASEPSVHAYGPISLQA